MEDSVWDRIDKIVKPITTLFFPISAIVDSYQFIQLLGGNTDWLMIVFALACTVFSVFGLLYVGFSKRVSAIDNKTRLPRFVKAHRFARLGLIITIVLIFLAIGWLYLQNQALANKVIVLVANFDASNQGDYRVTDNILNQMHGALDKYDDVVIRITNEHVDERQGRERARTLGEKYNAALVLWGWYAKSGTDARIFLNVENLSPFKALPKSQSSKDQAPIADLDHFTMVDRLSGKMSALTLFFVGVIRLSAGDMEEAETRFSSALVVGNWPDSIGSKSDIYFYRGFARTMSGDWDKAYDDYSQSIIIGPPSAVAYFNRGLISDFEDQAGVQGKRLPAIQDYTEAIHQNPSYFPALSNRGDIYKRTGDLQKALDDYSSALTIDPYLAPLLIKRATTYYQLARYSDSVKDCTAAIGRFVKFCVKVESRVLGRLSLT